VRAPAHVKSKPIWSGGKSCERATSRKYRLKKSAREARREICQHLRSMTHTRGTREAGAEHITAKLFVQHLRHEGDGRVLGVLNRIARISLLGWSASIQPNQSAARRAPTTTTAENAPAGADEPTTFPRLRVFESSVRRRAVAHVHALRVAERDVAKKWWETSFVWLVGDVVSEEPGDGGAVSKRTPTRAASTPFRGGQRCAAAPSPSKSRH